MWGRLPALIPDQVIKLAFRVTIFIAFHQGGNG